MSLKSNPACRSASSSCLNSSSMGEIAWFVTGHQVTSAISVIAEGWKQAAIASPCSHRQYGSRELTISCA
eukprot:scaffold402553_cov24-Attheya_sp.AAC.1